ncbi:sensor domain-containing diguanylate cyclase [Exiguobacterium flavidum]|uniref:sensor domain-containing diguanylate cyclase n=1 Tax=Exiguobacterium flavidum TaxID=2184695 RepID=UPI000DF7E456|nr:sensor domain-containing diguanylate cyclase [Exiguobacterium flavidum]
MKQVSIRFGTLVALSIALLVFILTLVLTYTIGSRSTRDIENEAGASLAASAYQLADKMDYSMWARKAEVDLLANLPALQDEQEKDSARQLIDRLQETIPTFSWIGVTDERGNVVVATDGILEGASIAERPVFMNAQETSFIGDVHDAILLAKLLPNPSGEPLQFVDISIPLKVDGRFKGVIATHLSWEWAKEMERNFRSSIRSDMKDLDFLILSAREDTVLLGPDDLIGEPLNLASSETTSGWQVVTWPDGKEYLTGYAKSDGYADYEGLGWKVLVRQPTTVAFASSNQLQRYILVTGLTASVLTAVLGWLLSRLLTRPLKEMTEAAHKLREGISTEIPRHTGIYEVNILSLALRALVRSLTRTETERDALESLALHDPLTGLANRASLVRHLDQISSGKTVPYVIFYLDLDGFKQVNDRYGHHTGDLLLTEVADRLRDQIPSDCFVARLGGDEFLLLAERHDSEEELNRSGERLIQILSAPYRINGEDLTIGVSIGAAFWTPPDQPEKLIREADAALYLSKAAGKNRITFAKRQVFS